MRSTKSRILIESVQLGKGSTLKKYGQKERNMASIKILMYITSGIIVLFSVISGLHQLHYNEHVFKKAIRMLPIQIKQASCFHLVQIPNYSLFLKKVCLPTERFSQLLHSKQLLGGTPVINILGPEDFCVQQKKAVFPFQELTGFMDLDTLKEWIEKVIQMTIYQTIFIA